jgi:hypothetical protein
LKLNWRGSYFPSTGFACISFVLKIKKEEEALCGENIVSRSEKI